MYQIILYTLTFMTSLTFTQMNHPLAMGLLLLMQTLLICLISGLMTKSFWFAYILFLIFLGGLLILFIYVTSLASNEMFSLSIKLMIYWIMTLMLMMLLMMFLDKTMSIYHFMNNEMIQLSYLESYLNENIINLNKLYNYPNNFMTLMLINYLLICLIAIVKITNIFYGPLRNMK